MTHPAARPPRAVRFRTLREGPLRCGSAGRNVRSACGISARATYLDDYCARMIAGRVTHGELKPRSGREVRLSPADRSGYSWVRRS